MHTLNLKPTHKVVKGYYNEINQLSLLDKQHEGAVSPAFATLKIVKGLLELEEKM